jgi:hypothetical protein
MCAAAGLLTSRALAGPPVYHTADEVTEGPPRLNGPDADLTIRDGEMTGRLDGGAYDVHIAPDAARGHGPMGPIDVKLQRGPQGFHVVGVWNGGDIDVVLGASGLHGRMLSQIAPGDRGYRSCRYDLDRLGHGSAYSGTARCLGVEHELRYDVRPRLPSDLTDEQNVVLLVAYFAAPPPVFND